MNKDLIKLRKQLEQLQNKNQTFIIKLIDKTYLVKGQKLTEIDIIPNDLKIYEVDTTDRNFFYFFTREDGKPVYTVFRSVNEAIKRGEL